MSDLKISEFDRRRIQVEYAVPLIRHLQKELGKDAVNMALKSWTRTKTAAAEAADAPQVDFPELAASLEAFLPHGFEFEDVEVTDEAVNLNVRRCRFSELMDTLDARDIGPSLLCNHDFSEALESGARLSRTKTIMKGFDHCNFRYSRK